MNLHIITGASRGLGLALAQYFLKHGDHVVDLSRTGKHNLSSFKSYACDLSQILDTEKIFAQVFTDFPMKNYSKLSFINNAGLVNPVKIIEALPAAEIYKNVMVNLATPFVLTSAFLKFTIKSESIKVISNISTGVAKDPKISWSVYCATKSGLESLSESIAREYVGNRKVKVINFEPGIIDTDMQNEIRKVSKSDFEDVDRFISFKRNNELLPAERVAEVLGKRIQDDNLAPRSFISVYEYLNK